MCCLYIKDGGSIYACDIYWQAQQFYSLLWLHSPRWHLALTPENVLINAHWLKKASTKHIWMWQHCSSFMNSIHTNEWTSTASLMLMTVLPSPADWHLVFFLFFLPGLPYWLASWWYFLQADPGRPPQPKSSSKLLVDTRQSTAKEVSSTYFTPNVHTWARACVAFK